MTFDEIFNPGAKHLADHLASEKILPAPAPVAGAPLQDGDGLDVIIPVFPGEAVPPDPPRMRRDGDLPE